MNGNDLRGHLAWPYDEMLRRRHARARARILRARFGLMPLTLLALALWAAIAAVLVFAVVCWFPA